MRRFVSLTHLCGDALCLPTVWHKAAADRRVISMKEGPRHSASHAPSFPPYPFPPSYFQSPCVMEAVGAYQTGWLAEEFVHSSRGGGEETNGKGSSAPPGTAAEWFRLLTSATSTTAGRGSSETSAVPRRSGRHWPSIRELWSCEPHDTLQLFAQAAPYHDMLSFIMEHGKDIFLPVMELHLLSPYKEDVPLPHVVYEDLMKVCTFSSLQNPPETQFQLSRRMRLGLLSIAARVCLLDSHYITQVKRWWSKMEQQQSLTVSDYSAFVWACAAAGDLSEAFRVLVWMSGRDAPLERGAGEEAEEDQFSYGRQGGGRVTSTHASIPFCPTVFALLQHPSVSYPALLLGHQPHVVKGIVQQERFAKAWASQGGSAGVGFPMGVHAVFVHYCLTLQKERKWEWLEMALSRELNEFERRLGRPSPSSSKDEVSVDSTAFPLCLQVGARTLRLALDVFAVEKGWFCSPQCVKLLVYALLTRGEKILSENLGDAYAYKSSSQSATLPGTLLFLLIRFRRNEIFRHDAASQKVSMGEKVGTAHSASPPLLTFSEEEIEYCLTQLRRRGEEVAAACTEASYNSVQEGILTPYHLVEPLLCGLMKTPTVRSSEITAHRREGAGDCKVVSAEREEDAFGSWKSLLKNCAAFGRQQLKTPSSLPPPSSSFSSMQHTSGPMAAQLVFRELAMWDSMKPAHAVYAAEASAKRCRPIQGRNVEENQVRDGTARISSTEHAGVQPGHAEEVASGAPSAAARSEEEEETRRRREDAVWKEGSQEHFTRQTLKEEERLTSLRERLPTAWMEW